MRLGWLLALSALAVACVDLDRPAGLDCPAMGCPDASVVSDAPVPPIDAPGPDGRDREAGDPLDGPSDMDGGDDGPPEGRGKGERCASNQQCASGFCADGVCCENACSNACEACNLPDQRGTCAPVPGGEDPHNDCQETAASSCGLDGFCDGNRACRLHVAGTQCAPGACANAVEATARTCDGAGTCRPSAAKPCAPYRCAGAACATSCASSADCGGVSCDGGQCAGLRPVGAACTAADQCGSGFCADGVCCNVACQGACQSCALAGSVGICAPFPAGQDPASECAASDAASCGLDGACDGVGACRFHAAGTSCAAPTCASATLTPARTCDGTGSCQAGAPVSCRGYVCASGTDCALACTGNADCVAPHICIAGTCQTPRAVGATCTADGECASGTCAQGVCCATACNGTCQSCALAGSLGTCTVVPAGQDPLNQCPQTAASTCGTDGSCNGAGACRLYVAGTECVAPNCSGASTYNPRRTCNGSGVCQPVTASACDPYICDGTSCKKRCNKAADCISGSTCVNNVCTSVKKAIGESCAAGTDCLSGQCAQGVCCNTGCTGLCQACNLLGTEGTCSPIPAGQDPRNQCSDAGATSCGTTGSCNGAGACAIYPAGTVCAAGACSNGTLTAARTCDGAGTCRTTSTSSCGTYQCSGTGCLTSCSSQSDCASPSVCSGGACGGLKGEYFDGKSFEALKFTRTDHAIDFSWAEGSPDSRIGDTNTFSVRWTGRVVARHSELYTFYTQSDDGVRLWVNGLQLVNNWTNHASAENSQTIQLTAGQSYDIRLEYFEDLSASVIRLSWSSPSQPKQVVPTSQLVPAN